MLETCSKIPDLKKTVAGGKSVAVFLYFLEDAIWRFDLYSAPAAQASLTIA